MSLPLVLNNSDCFQYFMLPRDNYLDFSKPKTPSEQVNILQMNLTGQMPEPFRGDIAPEDVEKVTRLAENNQCYLELSETEKRIY